MVDLKILSPNLNFDNELIERFHREAHIAVKIHHQNIVLIYDEGTENGLYYIAMKLLSSKDIDSILKGRKQFSVE